MKMGEMVCRVKRGLEVVIEGQKEIEWRGRGGRVEGVEGQEGEEMG